MRAFRSVLASFVLSACWQAALAEPLQIDWPDLVDEAAQSFEDPFRDLTFDQLVALRTLVNAEESLASGDTEEEDRSQLEAKFADADAELKADGIDADWLISQRWIVADRRIKAMSTGNADLDGAEISLAGFAIPVPLENDGTRVAYLVPERGMCSHTPPPPTNQLVRLELDDDWSPTTMHEPVVVSGVLSISPSKRSLLFVDGFQTLDATFSMDVAGVRTFGQMTAPSASGQAVSGWGEALADRIQKTRDTESQSE